MRALLVVLALVVLVFAAAAGLGASGIRLPADAPQSHGDSLDGGWTPPPLAALTAGLTDRFAPSLLDEPACLAVPAGPSCPDRYVARPAPDAPVRRIAHLSLQEGGAVLATFQPADRDPAQALCLCRPGTPLAPAALPACPQDWRERHRVSGAGAQCREDDAEGRLVAGRAGGILRLQPLGPPGARVRLQ